MLVKTCMGIPSLEKGPRSRLRRQSCWTAETAPLLVRETIVRVKQVSALGGSFGRRRKPTFRQRNRRLDQRLIDLGGTGIQAEDKAITRRTNSLGLRSQVQADWK